MAQRDKCEKCGQTVTHLDAGFSPALSGMYCECGGRWVPDPDTEATPSEEEEEEPPRRPRYRVRAWRDFYPVLPEDEISDADPGL